MESMCFVRQQATSSHTTRCQVVILFWKIEKRGSGGCARMRGSGGSFCGGVWAESCHEFYSTKFWGLIIIFGATEFREAFLQRFCLINLKDLLRSWDLGVVTFWESHPAFSGSAPFFFLLPVFLRQEQEERWGSCWPLGCASKPTASPISLGRLWAGPLTDGMRAQSLKCVTCLSPVTPQVWPPECFLWNGHHVQRPADSRS